MTHVERRARPERESIHSGHFMVSHFEAEAQDDDDLTGTGVPVPDEEPSDSQQVVSVSTSSNNNKDSQGSSTLVLVQGENNPKSPQQISIETSLTKLFKCMTLAYRQKLTSPKWNRFKGVKLRWKDKIRLNNVIWRCWHMQFIKKKNTLVCQFASPLDVDLHVKPETTILEGKYWKRRAEAVTAEYKKWRMYHMTRLLGRADSSITDMIAEKGTVETFSLDDMSDNMLMDEDYINFMSDTLFSTITSNQPFAFPDTREIARGASLADFIQPSLGPLQPNLDDFMDTLEPFQELLSQTRLPPVPEESAVSEDAMYRASLPLDLYSPQTYSVPHAHAHAHAPPPASHMQPHLTSTHMSTGAAILNAADVRAPVKNEQLQMDTSGMYASGQDVHYQVYANMHAHAHAHAHNQYPSKNVRYSPANKIVMHIDGYNKNYSAPAVLPSGQSSADPLLQQPLSMAAPGPGPAPAPAPRPAYRERASRPRIAQYSGQLPSAHYPAYPTHAPLYASPAHEPYKKQPHNFKMPPQSVPVSPQQITISPTGSQSMPVKANFRSNSLPLGSQITADWTIAAPAPADIASAQASAGRVGGAGAGGGGVVRRRSRSSGGAGGRRVPPPLASVASEPALPQASVMLAHLLTQQNSQSMYKLNVSNEEVSPLAERVDLSPLVKQNSPATERASPAHSGSPGTSPPLSPLSPSEPRRATHLHAEQKRRCNIKNGFDTLQAIIPHLHINPATKVSKAAMLQKGAEYIRQLKAERNQLKEEMENLRLQIECLNNSISNCHSLLPATGAPVSRARASRLREMFARHVAHRTLSNWRYWIFSVLTSVLIESFSNCVSCSTPDDLVRSTLLWAEQHCSLVEMRPAVLNSLRVLCSVTDILTRPERLPEEARAAAAGAAHAVKPEPT